MTGTHHQKSFMDLSDLKDVRIIGLIHATGGSMRTNNIYKSKKELGMSHQTITDRLKKLEEDGWLRNVKSIKSGRLSSIWTLTPRALQAFDAAPNYPPHHPLKTLEEKLSDSSMETQDKMKLIEATFRDFQLILGGCAMSSLRIAIINESYAEAFEGWRTLFTLLVEQQNLGLLRLLHKHRKLVLKALPSVKEQASKLGLLNKRGTKSV